MVETRNIAWNFVYKDLNKEPTRPSSKKMSDSNTDDSGGMEVRNPRADAHCSEAHEEQIHESKHREVNVNAPEHDKQASKETSKSRRKGKKKAKEDEDSETLEFPKTFTLQMISETLQELRIVRRTAPPLIPLCRIMLNQAVRIINKEAKSLRETLRVDGYVMEKGSFILSITTALGSYCPITDQIMSTWDAYWLDANQRFESELAENEEWRDLSGKMFLCWDGNHRTNAWMQEIRDRYSLVRNMHFSVQATFVQIDAEKEATLVRAMSRINELNEAGIVHTKLKDILYGVHRMTMSNLSNFIQHIPLDELQRMRAQEVKAMRIEPWYPHTRYILARILYQSQIENEIEEAISDYKTNLSLEEAKVKAEKDVKTKWVKKMGKYLAILNPDLGDNWINLVTSKELENSYLRLTIEKLYDLTRAKVDPPIRVRWLNWMIANTDIVHSCKVPNNDKDFHDWVKKETWLEHLLVKTKDTLDSILEEGNLVINHHGGKDLAKWFWEFKLKYRQMMFKAYERSMSITSKLEDAIEIKRAAQRVCFRYLSFYVENKYIAIMPLLVAGWATLEGVKSMYSSKGNLDRTGGLSEFEIRNCPWWIDFPQGKIPEEEEKMHKNMVSSITTKKDVESLPESKKKRKRKDYGQSLKGKEDSDVEVDLFTDTKLSGFAKNVTYANVSLTLVFENVSDIARSINMKGETSFKKIREIARQVAMAGHAYKRGGVSRNWGANLVLLDFPTNEMPTIGHSTLPKWNICTTQLVGDAFTLATLCIDDDGVVVCLCLAGQLSMVDGHARKYSLERRRLYCLTNRDPLGTRKDIMGNMAYHWCYLAVYSRVGIDFGYFNAKIFSMKDLNQNSNLLHHVLHQKERLPLPDTTHCRFELERSVKFMEFLLHCFYPNGSFVLDLFAGTGSMMEACAIRGAHYYGIENDNGLVDLVKSLRGCMKREEAWHDVDFEGNSSDIHVKDVEEPSD